MPTDQQLADAEFYLAGAAVGVSALGGFLGVTFDGVYFRLVLSVGVVAGALAAFIHMWRARKAMAATPPPTGGS